MNFQEPTTISNACTKKAGDLLNAPRIFSRYVWLNKQTGLFSLDTVTSKVEGKFNLVILRLQTDCM